MSAGTARCGLVAASLLSFLVAAGPARTDGGPAGTWELHYARREVETRLADTQADSPEAGSGRSEPTVSTAPMIVRLESSRLAIRVESAETIYDFDEKAIYYLEHQARLVARYALHSDIGFRVAEYRNRLVLGRALEQARIAGAPFDPVAVAIGLSIDPDGVGGTVEQRSEGSSMVFLAGGQETARVAFADRACPAALRAALRRFLVYGCRLHPDARRRIIETGRIPRTLTYRVHDSFRDLVVHLELRDIRSGAAAIGIPADYSPPQPDTPLDALLVRMEQGQAGDCPGAEVYAERSTAYEASGSFADAFLTLIEMSLSTGADVSGRIRGLLNRHADDPRLREVREAVTDPSTDPGERLERYAAVDRDGLDMAWLLGVFEANWHTEQGDVDEARRLFLAALGRNPCLAGVYKDLGDIEYRRYEVPTAWRYWDVARRIAPDHPMLEGIAEYERTLESAYPEFF
ncbi:MAG: hypothetical protein Kow0062_13680 [Acidobacteriota bacterium]